MRHKRKNDPRVRHEGAWCTYANIGFGITVFAYFVTTQPSPVGLVWGIGYGAGNGGKSRFEVMGSFVSPWARRNGVRTAINRTIAQHYDVVTTQSGSSDGGLAFLRASGYTLDRASGVWSLPLKNLRSR